MENTSKATENECCDWSLTRHGATLARGLSSINGLRLLFALNQGEKCVGELVSLLGMAQPLASQQLNMLYARGLVEPRRSGGKVYYSISDKDLAAFLERVLEVYSQP